MLQLVAGMPVEQISALYLMPVPALAQRLVRSKRKIRDAGISPRLPSANEISERTGPVLDAIYGLYIRERKGESETNQAHDLILILAGLLAEHAETLDLAALISFCESRRRARTGPLGDYIPLDVQDIESWDTSEIEAAESYLQRASQLGSPGRFQLEAAIQSAHVARRRNHRPTWQTIVALYDRLLEYAPTAGFMIGRISAIGHAAGSESALQQLSEFAQAHPDLAEEFSPTLRPRHSGSTPLGGVQSPVPSLFGRLSLLPVRPSGCTYRSDTDSNGELANFPELGNPIFALK